MPITVGEPLFSEREDRVNKEVIDKIMCMYGNGVSVEAIAKYSNLNIKETNKIIDTFQDAYFD